MNIILCPQCETPILTVGAHTLNLEGVTAHIQGIAVVENVITTINRSGEEVALQLSGHSLREAVENEITLHSRHGVGCTRWWDRHVKKDTKK